MPVLFVSSGVFDMKCLLFMVMSNLHGNIFMTECTLLLKKNLFFQVVLHISSYVTL